MTCRNVLIYFGQTLQRRVIAAAHYCLNQPGYLLLGPSESTSGVAKWFTSVSKGEGLFARRPGRSTFRFAPRGGTLHFPRQTSATGLVAPPRADGALARQADDAVLERYGPPGVVVNDRLEVVQFRGRTGPYLEPPDGEPQSQLLKMARAGLAAPLRIAMAEVRRTSTPVRKENVQVEGSGQACDLVVLPVKANDGGDGAFVVLFEERKTGAQAPPGGRRPGGRTTLSQGVQRRALEEDLSTTKEYVAVLLEEQGRTTDALASANDELLSGNEELQSLNEELETAKEELQATNEELTTVNDELNGRNQELQAASADISSILETIEIPVLMLDAERRIQRFTHRASEVMGLTPADVGRWITEVAMPLAVPDLERWIARAMRESILVEAEVQDRGNRWHRLQVRPRRGPGGKIDGAILSLADIDALRSEIVDARVARDYARSIVEAVQIPLLVLDAGLHVLSANAAYHGAFPESPAPIEGRDFFGLGAGQWNTTEVHRAVGGILGDRGSFQGLEMEWEDPGAGRRATTVSGSMVPSLAGEVMVLLSIEDVTDRRFEDRPRADIRVVGEGTGS